MQSFAPRWRASKTRALNKYTGIRKARNYILAHFNRDKKKNFFPYWKALREVKLPRTQKEIKQIYIWLHLINGIIVSRYFDELTEISNNSKIEVEAYYRWVQEQEKEAELSPTPFDDVLGKVEERIYLL